MKRVVITVLGLVVLGAAGLVLGWNLVDGSSVATADARGGAVPRAKVEQHAVQDFPFKGPAPDAVHCPGPLAAQRGTTVSCTAAFGKQVKTMQVTAEKVAGDQVHLAYALLPRKS